MRLSDLSELIAGIPGLIGYPPTESLVVFTFRSTRTLWLSTTMRADLPTPDLVPQVVDELVNAAIQNTAVAAIAVVVGGDLADDLPHRRLVTRLRTVFEAAGVALVHASWLPEVAREEQWHCYEDPTCVGTVPDPSTSTVAAAITLAGGVTFPSRTALAAQLSQDDEQSLARREKLLDEHIEKTPLRYDDEALANDLATVRAEIKKTAASRAFPSPNDKQLVRLAMALSQPEVRDECLKITLSEDADAAELLWTALTRSLPAPERAEPAYLLAMSAYLRGDGVLAASALRTALEANRSHAMAAMLDQLLAHAVPPENVRNLLKKAVTEATTRRRPTEARATAAGPPEHPNPLPTNEPSVSTPGLDAERTEPAAPEPAEEPEAEPSPAPETPVASPPGLLAVTAPGPVKDPNLLPANESETSTQLVDQEPLTDPTPEPTDIAAPPTAPPPTPAEPTGPPLATARLAGLSAATAPAPVKHPNLLPTTGPATSPAAGPTAKEVPKTPRVSALEAFKAFLTDRATGATRRNDSG